MAILSSLQEDDLTWNYADVAVWTAAELSVTIISTSLPSLRPLFTQLASCNTRPPKQRSASGAVFRLRAPRSAKSSTPKQNFTPLIEADGGAFGQYGQSKRSVQKVAVVGGHGNFPDVEGAGGMVGSDRSSYPVDLWDNRIHVQTTISITDGIEWQRNLF